MADVQVTLTDCDNLLSDLAGVDFNLRGLGHLSTSHCLVVKLRSTQRLLEGRRVLGSGGIRLLQSVNWTGTEGVFDHIIEDSMQDVRGDGR